MIKLTEKGNSCKISMSFEESSAVKRAAEDLSSDLEKICGCRCILMEEDPGEVCRIYIGTMGYSRMIDSQIRAGKLNIDKLIDETGKPRWEGYVLQEIEGNLYIAGTDRRGTIYGIYEFSCTQGVSPWYYFADVPVKKKAQIEIPEGYFCTDYPSVQYRGIFLNDEEELNAWARKHTKDDTIGPEAYAHIFELLLRLKGNYIWPAMHVNYFNENPENGRLADEMGIVVGTSHCDMLLRSNQNEWHPWIEKKGYKDVAYDYSIEGENREILKEYWRESVEQNKDYEVCFTMGMRGIHDTGFLTAAIDTDETLTEEEKEQKRVELLETVISDQRQILKEVLGERKGGDAMQTFVPYKEVLRLYNQGLKVPDDVTIIWVNDNHGYIRRYPDTKERCRKGGNGLYYHNSYWAPPPMSYLFINSIPLAHTGNELKKAYESGIQKLWVLNVGALKPLEQDIEFFIRCGWEAGKSSGITKDTDEFTRDWIDRNFTGSHGTKAAEIYNLYAQTTNVRKVEHMDNHVFSQTAWGNEAGMRIQRLQKMYDGVNAVYLSLPEEEKPAFFQMFLMKMHASYFTNMEFYFADRSQLSYERGNMQAADSYINLSRSMAGCRRWMIHYYNKILMEGKWDGILTPEKFPPPPTAMYPAGTPALWIPQTGLSVYVDGRQADGDISVSFDYWGAREKAIELGNTGRGKALYEAEILEGKDWLELSESRGGTETEQILYLRVRDGWKGEEKTGLVEIRDVVNGKVFRIPVYTEFEEYIDKDYCGFVEADGCISMKAGSFYANIRGKGGVGWERVRHLGRCEGDAMMAHNTGPEPLETDISRNPYLEYKFFARNEGAYYLELYRFLTLNATGKIRLAVSVDDMPPSVLESEIRDEWLGNWKSCVMDNGEKLKCILPFVQAGAHILRIYMIDNYVTFSKVVLYTKGYVSSDLGPAESLRREKGPDGYRTPYYPKADLKEIAGILNRMYGYEEKQIPLLPVVYAAKDFWEKDILYMKNEQYSQKTLGKKKYTAESKMRDGGIFSLFGEGVFQETDGILAIEAEFALENSPNAYLTESLDGREAGWSHLQAETNGQTGLAMYVKERGLFWENPHLAPGMHYKIQIYHPGVYHIWLLLRFFDEESDSCYFALDGQIQSLEAQPSKGNLFTYSTTQVYFWSLVTDMELEKGTHTLSVLARKSGLRIDRIYCTAGEERPWKDDEWTESIRR